MRRHAGAQGPAGSGDALFVEVTGEGPPLARRRHGFALHGGLFAPVVPALARSHRVHVVDLPGHGHSAEGAATLAEMVDAVASVDARSAQRPACWAGPWAAWLRSVSRSIIRISCGASPSCAPRRAS